MKITIDKTHFRSKRRRVSVRTAIPRLMGGMDTGEQIIPDGFRAMASDTYCTWCVFEVEPGVRNVRWNWGDGGRKHHMISFPYLVFITYGNGYPAWLFFRNQPLRSLDDELYEPALPNCLTSTGIGVYWVCGSASNKSLSVMAQRFRSRFFATGFNKDGYGASGHYHYMKKGRDAKKISTPGRWAENTLKDPSFILKMEWIKSDATPRSLLERVRRSRQLILPAGWQVR